MAVENICNFFKYGYCKFKMSCKNKHVTIVCDDENCNPQKCEKRHPRLCKYISNYGSCKLGSICAYSHKDHNRKDENKRLEKKLDELIAMVNTRDDTISKYEKKIEDLMVKNNEKDAVIDKLVNDVKELNKIVKEQIICKKKENEELSSKTKDVTSVINDTKKSLRSSKKKEHTQDNNEMVSDFTTVCLNIVDETEDDMKCDTDIKIIRQKYLSCTEKIDEEVIAQNVIVDFALRLMLSNMKLVNENTNKEMINLKMNCLRRGLSDFKVKQLNDRKK